MAEERFIDEDKDKNKKYRFRINEDGEEELDMSAFNDDESADDGDEVGLDFGEEPVVDEDYYFYGAEDSTEETQDEKEAVESLLEKAEDSMSVGNFSTALEYLTEAKRIAPNDGAVAAFELAIYTCNMTDFSPVAMEGAIPAANRVAEFSSAESKQWLCDMGAARLGGMIDELSPQVDELYERNEQGKAERAGNFAEDNKKSVIRLIALLIPFVVTLALAIYFSTIMYINTNGTFIILTIVFAALALIFFIICIFAARALNITARRVRMNRDNSRTQVGRDYLVASARLNNLRTIYDAITK